MNTADAVSNPWYREPWPWIIMAGPAAVVVAGVITIWIAFATSDGLVAEDYYKQGLAINQVLKREAAAAGMGLKARVEFPDGFHRIRVSLDGAAPAELRVRLAHATRAGHDLQLRLVRTGIYYEAAVTQELAPGRWSVQIEDPGRQWRLAGEWSGKDPGFSVSSDRN
jgi:hypothetical protein